MVFSFKLFVMLKILSLDINSTPAVKFSAGLDFERNPLFFKRYCRQYHRRAMDPTMMGLKLGIGIGQPATGGNQITVERVQLE